MVSLLLASFTTSAVQTKRHVAADSNSIEVVTYYGEKVAQFSIRPEGKKFALTFRSSSDKPTTRDLSVENYNYLEKKFEKLPEVAIIPASCLRNQIVIQVTDEAGKVRQKTSCFGIKTITSKPFEDFANLLVQAL
jgi:hypothetical protein